MLYRLQPPVPVLFGHFFVIPQPFLASRDLGDTQTAVSLVGLPPVLLQSGKSAGPKQM